MRKSSIFPATLSRYLARTYALHFVGLLAALLGVVYLFDTVELLRRAGKYDDIPLSLVLQMGLFKLPEVGQLVFPFAVLFAGMSAFWSLTRRHELIVVRSAGMSVWQFLAPVLGVALLIGLIQITIINPFGAIFVGKFETMETQYLNRQASLVSLSEQGLWLRQEQEDGSLILHADTVKMPEWVLRNVMVVFLGGDDTFQSRIDARSAVLDAGRWQLHDATLNRPRALPERNGLVTLDTSLTVRDIEESFASPETIPFWQLPSYIRMMEATGFDTGMLRIHYQSLLASPLLFTAMILLAASVSLKPPRLRGTGMLIVMGVIIGFGVFFASSFLQALGASGQIPVLMAAWCPAVIAFLAGLGAMMILEDG